MFYSQEYINKLNEIFVHLHVHSEYSNIRILDSINKIEDMITYVNKLGNLAMAITDHECLSSHVKFLNIVEKLKSKEKIHKDFKPILGNEIYLVDEETMYEEMNELGKTQFYHFILLAKDNEGHEKIRKLSTKAWKRMFNYKGIERVPTFYSDIEEIINESRGHLIASSACFLKGTDVLTQEGIKNIEDIKPNDLVFTHTGSWEKVNYPTTREYNGNIHTIQSSGGTLPIQSTENHKFLVLTNEDFKNYVKFTRGEQYENLLANKAIPKKYQQHFKRNSMNYIPKWIEAKDLKIRDFLLTPINDTINDIIELDYTHISKIKKKKYDRNSKELKKYIFEVNDSFLELLGLFCAEGHLGTHSNSVNWTFHTEEKDLHQKVIDFLNKYSNQKIHSRKKSKSLGHDICVIDKNLYAVFNDIFKHCSHNYNKKTPDFVKLLPPDKQMYFIKGLFLGDGYYQHRTDKRNIESDRIIFATTSKQLAYETVEIFMRNNINPLMNIRKEHMGRDGVFHRESYEISINGKTAKAIYNFIWNDEPLIILPTELKGKDISFTWNGIKYMKNKIIKNTYEYRNTSVYCLNVDIDNSFLANGVIVHNCLGGRLPNLILNLLQEENEEIQEQIKDEIDNFINWCLDLFGEDFYIELQPSLQQEQIDFNIMAIKIAKAYGIKWIISTDAHYLTSKDREIHKAFLTSEDDENNNREVDMFYSTTYFFTVEEIFNNMNYLEIEDIERGILNTKEISDKVIGYNFKHKQIIPKIKLPNESNWYKNEKLYQYATNYPNIINMINSNEIYDRYLISLIFKGISEKIKKEDYKETFERIDIECKEIIGSSKAKDEPLSSYFITMEKNIEIIWEEAKSIVAPGRGSAGGFIIDYLIGITQINPLKQGIEMPHWRFISADRPDYPDIDIDISSHKKDIVFQKVQNYYNSIGGDIVRVATFGTETSKSAIQTACFKKGTQINTLNGIKSIEYIEKGDWVETINGWEQVINPTFSENKTLINLKTRNSSESFISCTEDHEFLMVNKCHKGRMNGIFNKDKINKYYPEILSLKSIDKNYQKLYGYCREVIPNWIHAKDITMNDYGLKRIDLKIENFGEYIHWKNEAIRNYDCGISTRIKINEEFCELIGIWLAEGSSNRNRISFSIHQEEEIFKNRIISLMWNVFQLDNYYIQPRKDTKGLDITYSSRQIFNLFSQIFEVEKISDVNQWNKYIPNKLKFIAPSLQLQIFKGWFIGDGYARRGTESKATTVSKQLCEDMIFILNRNFINPYIIKEEKNNKNKTYNLMLYGAKAKKLSKIKYYSNLQNKLEFTLDDFSEMDFPVFWNNQVYLKTKIEKMDNSKDNLKKQRVYCLKIPSETFTVNGTIVHNCRGLKINNDIALYLSSLVPVERGKVWSVHDCFYGDEEKGRKSITEFKNMIGEYTNKNLLHVILGIEGLINKRSSHPCGIIIVNEEFTKHNSVMRSPSGELISAYELNDSEYCGNLKYDFLNTKTCSMIQLTLEMLVNNNKIKWQGSLRKTYDKYLHPDIIDKESLEMWNILNNGELISAFQFDSPVGEKAIKLIQPVNLLQATDANNLMRLMGEEGKEQPLDMYVRYKTDINEWYKDMKKCKLTDTEIKIIEKHLLKNYGVCSTQESMMMLSMDKDIANFNVIESNILRKGVAKKIGETFEKAHNLLYEKGNKLETSKNLLDYIWDIQIAMQRGYGFSLLHGIEYTYILIQQLNLVYYYPSIYWNTAVLLIESGALEKEQSEDSDIEAKERTTNYGEIAKAIGKLQSKDINISLPYINKAEQGFLPDEQNNEIIFGFKGIMKINNETAQTIMQNRPYKNLKDFHERLVLIKKETTLKTGKSQMRSLVAEGQTIMLIKAGAFDKIENKTREEILENYLRILNPSKIKLNSKDIGKIAELGIIPIELKDELRFYNFREYLTSMKKIADEQSKTIFWYKIKNQYNDEDTEYANNFFLEHFANDMQEDKDYKYDDEGYLLIALGTSRKGSFESVYKNKVIQLNKWITTEECIKTYTDIIFQNIKNQYMKGNISSWEMESMSFYSKESGHELANVNKEKYGIVDFYSLPEEPIVIGFTKYKGLQYPKFQLDRIIGTVLDRDKNKHSVTILTPSGVVTLKFYSGQFSFYDKTISKDNGIDDKGKTKKIILENGWFKRSELLLITGFRRGDIFKPKRYKNSVYQHSIQRIIEVKEDGNLILQSDRVQLVE